MKFVPNYARVDQDMAPVLQWLLGTGQPNNQYDYLGQIEYSGLIEPHREALYGSLTDPNPTPLKTALQANPYIAQNVEAALATLFQFNPPITPQQQQFLGQLEPVVRGLYANALDIANVTQELSNYANGNGVAVSPAIQQFVDSIPIPYGAARYDNAHCQAAATSLCREAGNILYAASQNLGTYAAGLANGMQQNPALQRPVVGPNQPNPNQPGPNQPHPYVLQNGVAIRDDVRDFLAEIEHQIGGTADGKKFYKAVLEQLKTHDPNRPFSVDQSKIPISYVQNPTHGIVVAVNDIVNQLNQYLTGTLQQQVRMNGQNIDGSNITNAVGAAGLNAAKGCALESLTQAATELSAIEERKKKRELKDEIHNVIDAQSRGRNPGGINVQKENLEKIQDKITTLKDQHEKIDVKGRGTLGKWLGFFAGLAVGIAITVATAGAGWPALFACPAIGYGAGKKIGEKVAEHQASKIEKSIKTEQKNYDTKLKTLVEKEKELSKLEGKAEKHHMDLGSLKADITAAHDQVKEAKTGRSR